MFFNDPRLWLGLAAGLGLATWIAVLGWRWFRRRRQPVLRRLSLTSVSQKFHRQREWLEARFWQLASESGKPRGLRWVDCDFEDGVAYARDRASGELSAFVAVTIRFEAVEGEPMQHVEAVSRLRAATAVFRFGDGKWETEGRAIFNLNPAETIQHFRESLVLVGEEPV